ncbi:uncharacterized protein LTR77_003738 [Saxophila tyrrhenica]|uniref:Uncharacterized protein n=1 Tax=Saxophila tyrrhenica TaxID=1690608 RepID=A0AAV9PEY0_9PEZI|nr:hypothetical protein LTR77_003738 [Saxophila tyrrhenica]
MPRQGGLIKVLGTGVGMAAEYHEHRKQKKLSRENSQQSVDQTIAGPSNRPEISTRELSAASDLPPAYEDIVDEHNSSLAAGRPVADDKKAALRQYNSDSESDDLEEYEYAELQGDEAAWDLDEAVSRERGRSTPPDTPTETSSDPERLVSEVLTANRTALAAAPAFERTQIPCPVIIPQRRPRTKARGFVRAYAPLLGECSGISQETFLLFLKNFHKASQASPVFPVIRMSAAIAGFAPSVIAMAVTTAVQFAAGVGQEVQQRQRTNHFLDRMNQELFQPAGLYAMIVKYKPEDELQKNSNSLLTRLGVTSEKVDLSTNQTIAKYSRALTSESASSGQSMSQRMQGLRLFSQTTKGSCAIPESAPLIFPDVDNAVALEGEESFKAKAKDAKGFLADYFDRKAQAKYATADPNSSLNVPDEQRAFRSKLADPSHPMYNGGIVGFVSGGALTRDRAERDNRRNERRWEKYERKDLRRERRDDRKDFRREMRNERKDERRLDRFERRLDKGRSLSRSSERRHEDIMIHRERRAGLQGRGPIGMLAGAVAGRVDNGQSREYEDAYRSGYDGREMRRSFEDRNSSYGQWNTPAPYSGQQSFNPSRAAPYGGQGYVQNEREVPGAAAYRGRRADRRGSRQKKGGLIKKIMTEDVLYLLIVNMPSEEELAEARATLETARGH